MTTTLRLGSNGPDVKLLQQALIAKGYKIVADGAFGPKTEDAVEAFQRSQKLYADGIAGKITLTALGIWDSSSPTPAPTPQPTEALSSWVRCPADKLPNKGGYTYTVLRFDTAQPYSRLYDSAHMLGGTVTSAGGKRALASKAGPNRSRTSMHYVGRAFDVAVPTGMIDPETDQYICVQVPGTHKWTVWCRSTLDPDELADRCKALGIAGGTVTLDGTYVQAKKVLHKPVLCVAFDFTALARKYGFASISARKAFFDKADVGAAEWWHFQWVTGLVKGKSTFGSELLKIYSLADAQKFVYWTEAKDAVYGVSWF